MSLVLKSSLLAILISITASAMEARDDFIVEDNLISRLGWQAKPAGSGLKKHSGPIKIMVIGHTLTKLGDSVLTMKSMQRNAIEEKKWADIGYHYCLDVDGKCFEGRPLDTEPCMIVGHNDRSCALGLIGRFDENVEAMTISGAVAKKWAKHIAKIAYDLGFEEIKRGRDGNIFAMSELSSKYPISPGQRFLDRFDEIVSLANLELIKRKN